MTRIRFTLQLLFIMLGVAISVLLGAPAWAAYVIYVQGTNNAIPGQPNVPMNTIFNGSFNACSGGDCAGPANIVQNLKYPATQGLLNVLTYKGGYGLLPPTMNQSVALGVAALDAQIKADQAAIAASSDPTTQIYVIGLSQGSVVGTEEALVLAQEGSAAYQNVTFILAGNLDRAAPSGGGILTQIPIPITIPGVLTAGGGVMSTPPPTNGPTIINVTNQGDPFANFNPANPAAITSGVLQYVLTGNNVGPHNYSNTVLTPAMVTGNSYPSNYVVTKTGNLTDVFVPSSTPSPSPHIQTIQPVKTFQPLSAPVQSSLSTPKPTLLTLPTSPVAPSQLSLSAPKPLVLGQVTKPTAMQQSTKLTDTTQQHLIGHGAK